MIPEVPMSRVETYLAKILGQDVELPVPQTRSDLFWANLAGGTFALPVPQSREEIFLAKLLGEDLELPTPQSRVELFLAQLIGLDVITPEPESREELYLAQWAIDQGWVTVGPDPIVSFNAKHAKALRSLVVSMTPQQDLNGYSNPWPAGGGKNLFNGNDVVTTTPSNWGITFANDVLTIEHKNSYSTGAPDCPISLPVGTYVASFASQTQNGKISLRVDGSYNKTLANGTTFTVEEGHAYSIGFSADASSTNTITKLQIESGSTPSSYAPFSNICPISGYSALNVEQTGINVWDEEYRTGYYDGNGAFHFNENILANTNPIYVKAGATYYIYVTGYSSNILYVHAYDADGNKIKEDFLGNTAYTAPENCAYINFNTWAGHSTGTYSNNISINYPSTDHDYNAYIGTSIPITIPTPPGTVYGGTDEVISGTGESTYADMDLGTLNWTMNHNDSLTYECYASISGKASGTQNFLCNALTYKPYADDGGYGIRGYANSALVAVRVPKSVASTPTTLGQWLTDNGVKLVYELATPVSYTHTANPVDALVGTNNVWCAEAGTEVAVTYNQA